jgi:hypothetical protein
MRFLAVDLSTKLDLRVYECVAILDNINISVK